MTNPITKAFDELKKINLEEILKRKEHIFYKEEGELNGKKIIVELEYNHHTEDIAMQIEFIGIKDSTKVYVQEVPAKKEKEVLDAIFEYDPEARLENNPNPFWSRLGFKIKSEARGNVSLRYNKIVNHIPPRIYGHDEEIDMEFKGVMALVELYLK
ncbi:hypothetical protein HZA33_03185 [Candidatus Pacearchaeota archaeon]|nr:hypothetical protein [Candidatus Pacearchaeota archaeon]